MEVALTNCRDARELKTSERKDSDVGRGGGDDEDDADDHDDTSDDVKVIKRVLVADEADEAKESAPIITSNGDAKSVTDDDEDDAVVAKTAAAAAADVTAIDEPVQRVDDGLVINGNSGDGDGHDKDKDLEEEEEEDVVVDDKAALVKVDNGEKAVTTTPTENNNDDDAVDDGVIQQQEEEEEEEAEEVVDDAASIYKDDAKAISEEEDEEDIDEEEDGEELVDELKAADAGGLIVSVDSVESVSVLEAKKPRTTTEDVGKKKVENDNVSVSNAEAIDASTEMKDGKKENKTEVAKSESKEIAVVEAKKPPAPAPPPPPAKKKEQSSSSSTSKYADNKEQTIIITETKSLAKAINDAVKQPDGKPTLVIIETKPGANATTATSTATPSSNGVVLSARSSSVTINSPVRRLTTMPMLKNQLSSIDYNGGAAAAVAAAAAAVVSPARQVGRPPSLLQGTLLASPITRFTPKLDPGPSVPLPDDAEVSVDVPSLVVPYLFECQARETLTHFLKKLGPLEEPNSEVMKPEQMSPTAAAIDSVARGIVGGKTYFDTSLGKFLMDIGLVQVQEWVQGEILKSQQRKLNKGWKTKEREKMVAGLKRTMEDSKRRTGQFRFALRKCPRCTFLSESSTVLDKHMETIHLAPGSTTRMLCCFCDYATEEAAAIFNHVYVKHGAFARLEKFHNCHMCPLCPFEDANKSRVTRHAWKCQKAYAPERNLAPSPDYEPPAKRTRLVASVATLKSMSASRQQQQQQQQMHQQSGNVLRDNLMSRGGAAPPPIRPKPGELRITPSYVQSVLRSSYVPPPTSVSRTVSQLLTSAHQSYVRSASAPGPRVSSPGGGNNSTLLLSRNQLQTNVNQPYTIQPSQLYQVVNTGSNVGGGSGSCGGGVLPVVRGTVGPFQSQPRFTILPTPPVTVTTRGPTPVALIPNLATTGHSSSFAAQMRSGNVSIGSNASQLRNMSGGSGGGVTRPNISITPVNKGMSVTSRLTTQAQPTSGTRTSQQQQQQQQQQQHQQSSGGGGSNSSYVVCEICDGYIKDLDQLRNHMQWIHKVKIHPKMIHNRPPLNCQKCHYRFFTDQGLERHLLGSHGLVTSSMQDNANKGKDGGRCIICGKVFLWKLVVHMAKDHKMTLKPAHLSYKCTVCSATFNMYRLFETHVYEEHSTVAKRVLDTPKPAAAAAAAVAAAAAASASKSKVSAAVLSSKDVVTVRSVSSSSSVTVTETKAQSSSSAAAAAAAEQKPTSSEQTSSQVRSCVECGMKFQCSSNCLDHLKESHVRPCRVELCRVDKCHKCTAKSQRKKDKDATGSKKTETVATVEDGGGDDDDDDDDDDDIVELDVVPKEKTKPEVVVIVDRETQPAGDEQGGDDVFDMEVETVDDHSSIAGSVQTDVESD